MYSRKHLVNPDLLRIELTDHKHLYSQNKPQKLMDIRRNKHNLKFTKQTVYCHYLDNPFLWNHYRNHLQA